MEGGPILIDKIKRYIGINKGDVIFLLFLLLSMMYVSKNIAVFNINGSSMYPTYEDGNVLIMKRDSKTINGSIAIFDSPESWGADQKKFIKRVVAVEGDEVYIDKFNLSVNDVKIDFNGKEVCQSDYGEELKPTKIILNRNEYLVLGDNYGESNDSSSQYCIGNDEVIINDSHLIMSGKELIKLERGLFN